MFCGRTQRTHAGNLVEYKCETIHAGAIACLFGNLTMNNLYKLYAHSFLEVLLSIIQFDVLIPVHFVHYNARGE